jgi:hypothetical protein
VVLQITRSFLQGRPLDLARHEHDALGGLDQWPELQESVLSVQQSLSLLISECKQLRQANAGLEHRVAQAAEASQALEKEVEAKKEQFARDIIAAREHGKHVEVQVAAMQENLTALKTRAREDLAQQQQEHDARVQLLTAQLAGQVAEREEDAGRRAEEQELSAHELAAEQARVRRCEATKDNALEAIQLLYRAYTPLRRRVRDLLAQKRFLRTRLAQFHALGGGAQAARGEVEAAIEDRDSLLLSPRKRPAREPNSTRKQVSLRAAGIAVLAFNRLLRGRDTAGTQYGTAYVVHGETFRVLASSSALPSPPSSSYFSLDLPTCRGVPTDLIALCESLEAHSRTPAGMLDGKEARPDDGLLFRLCVGFVRHYRRNHHARYSQGCVEEYSSAMQSVHKHAMRALVDCARAEKTIAVSAVQVQETHAQLRQEQTRAEALQRALEEHQAAMDAHHAHMEDVRVKIGGMVELEDFRKVENELQLEQRRAHEMSVELDRLSQEDANKTVMLEEADEADKGLKEQLGRKTQEFSTLQRFLRRQTSTTQGLEKDYQALRGAFQRLEKEFNACREKNAALVERLGVSDTRAQKLRGAHGELLSVNAEQEKQLEVYNRTLQATQKELGDARRAMEHLSGAYKDTRSRISGLDRDLHVSEEEMRLLRQELLSEVESSERSRVDREHRNNNTRDASRLDQDTML